MCHPSLPLRELQVNGCKIRTKNLVTYPLAQVSKIHAVLHWSARASQLADDGLGPRVPRYIISPYTRGGNVFTETSDHNSDIMFVEQWAAAQGYKGVYSKEMTQWRRDHMSNLVNAFDFDNVRTMTSYNLCLTEQLGNC
jgi:phospholipase C